MSTVRAAEVTPAEAARALRDTGAALVALASAFRGEEARWRPEPGRWSALEVINHLADEEMEDFRARVRMTLDDPGQSWPENDPEGWPEARGYATRDVGESIARFAAARADSVAWLEGLGEAAHGRPHLHPRHGPLGVGDLLAAWMAHDLMHLRQLTRLRFAQLRGRAGERATRYAGEW
jgi:hypothetical protein